MLQFLYSWAFPKISAMDERAEVVKASMEFAVQMHCQSCVNSIKNKLAQVNEISKFDIDLEKEQVVIESTLPSAVVQKLIEDTGRKVILKGIGGLSNSLDMNSMGEHVGAAVAVLGSRDAMEAGCGYSDDMVCGVVRFIQVNKDECIIEGVVDGLSPGLHGLHIHEFGNISQGCQSIGDHYNPWNTKHGGPNRDELSRHLGDLGNITADEMGRAHFRMTDRLLKTWDLIGRSVAVTESEDDLGAGNHPNSSIDGNSGRRISCGIIARSAGLFENPKRICACDGVTLWDETSGRLKKDQCSSNKSSVNGETSKDSTNQKSKY